MLFYILKTKQSAMRLSIFRYLIYILITWFLFQFYNKIKWHEKQKKYNQIKLKQLKKNFPDLTLTGRNSYQDMKSTKTILLPISVYGMDNWGIGFGTEPFKLQGKI